MKRSMLGSGLVAMGAAGCLAVACGGSTADMLQVDGGGLDAANPDATMTAPDSNAAPDEGAADAADAGAGDLDAAPPCAPPADPTKAALCIAFTHDALTFLAASPSFDGRGLLAVDVHDTPDPDAPDGGTLPALGGAIFPSSDGGGGDAGEIDLATALPAVRFDGLPAGAVYPRAIFIDSRDTQKVGAGWWLGGYDLEAGIQTHTPLLPVTLPAGVGTSITLGLTALRGLGVTLSRSVAPVGNGQGPATVVVSPDPVPGDASTFFGLATAPCANLGAADASAAATGFVLGAGPYYAIGVLDDLNPDSGLDLPPGALTSLSLVDGSLVSPSTARLQYAAGAYVVQTTLDLDLAIPAADGGLDGDPVSCP